jgi:predicted ATPase
VGQADEGLNVLDEALYSAKKSKVRFYEAELHRLKGELLRQKAECDEKSRRIDNEAEACFHKAIDISRHQQAKSLELRAAMSLSRLWQSHDRRKEAFNLLAQVYEWFTEGHDTTDLKDAKALIDQLS